MRKIYDISLTITPDMPVWPGDPTVILERIAKIENGANANISRVTLSVHTGTHVDSPYHFLPGGKAVDQLGLEVLVGETQVVQLPDSIKVISDDVVHDAGIREGIRRVLFKTRNSEYWSRRLPTFQKNFVGISVDGADALVDRGLWLVGIDYLSIAPFKQSRPTHEVLLRGGVVVVEGVDLSRVTPGMYELVCLPLKLGGSDGAPARAILIAD